MKNWFEPEWWYRQEWLIWFDFPTNSVEHYPVNVKPLDLETIRKEIWSKWIISEIDFSLLWENKIEYGTKLYNDVILQIQTMMSEENPRFAFNPKDRWWKVFEKWYFTNDFKWIRALEVWVWTGVNAIKTMIVHDVLQIVWSDLEPDVVALSLDNVQKYCPSQAHKYDAVESNLLSNIDPKFLSEVDFIMWCIPQAILPKWSKKNPDDSAHYYPWEYFNQYPFNYLALGLNEALLHQISQVSRQAKVLLNLAWRVWKDNLIELFETHWFNPEVKYEEIIPQCPSTSLDFFVKLEENWFNGCELYSDPNWSPKKRITAKEAERIRKNEVKAYKWNVWDLEDIWVYHSLHAIEWKIS